MSRSLYTAARFVPRLALPRSSILRSFATKPETPLEKYKLKLEQKAKEVGALNVDELKEKLKDEIEAKKKEFNAVDPLKELEEYELKQAEELKKKKQAEETNPAIRAAIDKTVPKEPYKTLSSFIDVEKVRELPLKELEFIWRARFQNKERTLQAFLESQQFATIFANAFKNPNFVLPLPRGDDGYEIHFVQWGFPGPNTTHCMLTTLAEYQLHKEYAKPHTTLMFHQELIEDKEVVLMNGQVESDVSLTMDEAQLLVLNVQRFYGGLKESEGSKRKLALLRDFTAGNPEFDMKKLVEEAASFD
ncbi:hypothetical protein C7M61_001997 [Candidozyma pseudohaemuli]|uniref:ATP synthase mitochondrial F1 complex assembly factor 1 n=1 Tax=Candidozyma pseudohaemuli TaxID=418784 RepID=A0A2P7YTT7_9ASCO|nr:hypothetical protein C7M61_001997 [[Candida] pseudohaemulonii]PSK39386.1 hypothetical protein C7M61_001997 [[Candida] pseudohaemulonii]